MPVSEDDGEEGINDVDEFLNALNEVAHDDVLADLIGEGYDITAPGDQDVVDYLTAWRDNVNNEPARNITDAVLPGQHSTGGQMPPTTTGETMSMQEEADRLRAIASSDDIPIGMLRAASQSLEGVTGQVQGVLTDQSTHLPNIMGLIDAAKQSIDAALGACQQVESAIHDAADGHARG